MSRPLWISLAIAALGGMATYGAGCGSSSNDNNGTNTQGGACCSCSSPECNTARTLAPPAGIGTIPNCTTYCQAQASFLANCSAGTAATIVGVGVACPKDGGVTPTGTGGAGGAGGSIGAGGSVGIGGSAGTPVVDGGGNTAAFGAACASDADCGGSLRCSKSSDNDISPGFGIPNGLCTRTCMTNSDCPALVGICVVFSQTATTGICMQLCNLGQPASAADLGQKCRGRTDEACVALTTASACQPICTSDADCGTRKCDPSTGYCSDTGTPSPVGAPCTQDTDCGGGFCLQFDPPADGSPSPGFCSAVCRLGNVDVCGYRRTPISAGQGPVSSCVFASGSSSGLGDVGLCGQLCDTTSDCVPSPGWSCDLDPTNISLFNHGTCDPFNPTDAGVPSGG
jgi:hypothetical protein